MIHCLKTSCFRLSDLWCSNDPLPFFQGSFKLRVGGRHTSWQMCSLEEVSSTTYSGCVSTRWLSKNVADGGWCGVAVPSSESSHNQINDLFPLRVPTLRQ